ncbi:hypothetical protein Rhopal_005341-T1 [Rhodotorula paludigena]|uniref:Late embryogenesis abundant protein LEA-2 subgroup domain-containing protein n=1 Tax=Rhodotorula paludigena TaxID=86838 RepID=A0AAV5GI27_9BASI|nr:hypothetical protein Rhopal_005341-T1 [Rhodotorula paludigena]
MPGRASQPYADARTSYEMHPRRSQSSFASPPRTSSPAAASLPHARYSSADLYALEQPVHAAHRSESGLLAHPEERRFAQDSDDDDEDDEGAGNPSGMSTLSRFDPVGSKDALNSTAKFGGETVEAPILSKSDWAAGEAQREKDEHVRGKKRRKREAWAGEARHVQGRAVGFVRRNWKWLLPVAIAFAVAVILLCYFLIPRTPTINFTSRKVPKPALTSSDDNPYISAADPTSFNFRGSIAFAIDASDSYLPVKYRSFGLTVRLQETNGIIAQETWDAGEISVAAKRETSYEFPLMFQGNYSSEDNGSYQIMRRACAHKYATIYRPPLNLTVTVSSSIWGVVNAPERTARLSRVECPIEWLANAS